MSGIVGREAELASVHAFVEGVPDGAAVLVLEGEAGMGKTTLWTAGVERAEEREAVVLQSKPSESETALSFAGIGDLLDPVLDRALEPLPPAQRRALARALVLEDDEGPAPTPHAVGVAVLNALRGLASIGPVIVAVDDVQWLDAASAAALAYAARRLRAEPAGVLLARRTPHVSALATQLRRSLPAGRLTELEVGPLDVTCLHHVVHDQLGIALPRPLLAEVHQAAGGNPFYALEIVRSLRRTGASVEAGQPLRVPESLHDLVHGRLLALPEETRSFLLAAAAHAHPTVAITEAASGVPAAAALPPALEARVVEVDRDRIAFTHPLLAAGAYEVAGLLRRREVHARLAKMLEEPEARAWQLAASVDEPDEEVAAVLEEAARHARARGAPRPGALLLDRARELTPADSREAALRRAVDAAFLHFESGDSRRAEEQFRTLIAELPPGRERARALVRFARVRSYETQAEGTELFLQAVEETEGDTETLAVSHEGVATCLFRMRERLDEAVEHADTAAELAFGLGDTALAAEALGTRLLAETLLGRPEAAATLERALELKDDAASRRVMAQPLVPAAVRWWWTDEVERAKEALEELLDRAGELGDESSTPYLLVILGQVECARSDLPSALNCAVDGQAAAEQSGQRTLLAYHVALEALVEALRGNGERARAAALEALEHVPETGGRPAELVAVRALGHLELALGDAAAAVERLAPSVAFAREQGIVEPAAIPFVIDQVEALVETGRGDEAVELLDRHEQHARRLGRVSALAACLRCRGLLAAAEGRLDDALAAFEDALERHGEADVPLDRARTLLALGSLRRRLNRRREARATLEEALALFERVGAALWAERARAELRRISGRAASPGALTPAEEKVAALAAEGKTNREVAAALYLSDRTVEGHLSHVFAKLGIRHRTELPGALAARQTRGVAAPNTGESPVSAESPAP